MNILFCSAGRRCMLLENFRKTMGEKGRIIATDLSITAPALYFADAYYLVPPVSSPEYIDRVLEICKKENVDVVTTCIDPEIMVLAKHRKAFSDLGIEVLAPYEDTAKLCFDEMEMYRYLIKHGIPTVLTYGDLHSFRADLERGKIQFPVFVKPRTGSGSVGARPVDNMEQLREAMEKDPSLIIQEYMAGSVDLDTDVYVDTVSHKPVSIFSKKKISTTIGGANKTISFHDDALIDFLLRALAVFQFNGPIDVDLFYRNGQYYLSEINPRFGGAYLHAYGAGVDFVKLIENNLAGVENTPCFHNYEENVVMMMYDSVVIRKIEQKDNDSRQ